MSLLRAVVLGVCLIAVSAAAADEKKKDDKKPAGKLDPAKLVGTWKITEGKRAGEKVGEDGLKTVVTVTKDTITLKGADGMTFEIAYKVDAKATPATIDMEITKPDMLKGSKAQGIVALEGGTFKLCYNTTDRPKKFESTKDDGNHLFVMKKEGGKQDKKEKKEDK